ncbi:guanine nucleotide-binding protein subunit gamma [Kluyveromyces marxianus]|uniref:Guanine nucleotide-binding protein subunit gamma n=2 Tax=Kluyveromyces marxianus TaxID=4911 RepID=W0TGN8_KLUMD|nr:guanine nucleotide-binding protein subunit gamma [Kluyveromyces marxianus DMKU3-1042]QGN18102.1 guanine nucleotide-binding protein subunit gamma [Kluyveromyces marxianus]BAO41966.1 guanine nucleotide-binding protein subunit gamma [Kluyveromyces marxianus DMKU3-1042]
MGELPYKIQLLKLRRIEELNNKLRNELARERITASNACLSIIDYASTQKDYLIPDVWGYPDIGEIPYTNSKRNIQNRSQNNDANNCCTIM